MDIGGSVSTNVRLHIPYVSLPHCKETTSLGGEWAAAPEMDLQFAAEATGIQPEQTQAPFRLMTWKNPNLRLKRARPEEAQRLSGPEVLAKQSTYCRNLKKTDMTKLNSPTNVISYPLNLFRIFSGFNQ